MNNTNIQRTYHTYHRDANVQCAYANVQCAYANVQCAYANDQCSYACQRPMCIIMPTHNFMPTSFYYYYYYYYFIIVFTGVTQLYISCIIYLPPSLQSSSVTLTDCKSKFGTFVGDRRLSSGEQVTLRTGEEVRFGQGLSSGGFR